MNPKIILIENTLLNDVEKSTSDQLRICNACRYCEGFCAVFPAMTKRLVFNKADIHYLANLCHNCGACLHACQYAYPHEFDVNIPTQLAEIREQTYTDFAWPSFFAKAYTNFGKVTISLLVISMFILLLIANYITSNSLFGSYSADFYQIIPHNTMALFFGIVSIFPFVALCIGIVRFWQNISIISKDHISANSLINMSKDTMTLKYLDGGHGKGCNNADDAFTLSRRRFHHLTFYGFLLCFLSTLMGTVYHYLFDLHAPYPLLSLPVLLGVFGGIGLIVGPLGLLYLNITRHPRHVKLASKKGDRKFILLLFFISLTGFLILILRNTQLMGVSLLLHLAFVLTFFIIVPYCKFVHGFYRMAALLKFAIESRKK